MNKIKIMELLEHLSSLAKRDHYSCEDTWYSCPKAEGGCANDCYPKDECHCGADKINEAVEYIERQIREELEKYVGES